MKPSSASLFIHPAKRRKGKCRVYEGDTGGKLSARFDVWCGGAPYTRRASRAGSIEIARRPKASGIDARTGKRFKGAVWGVSSLYVDPIYRRRGVATSLYEAAALFACKKRGRLASISRNPGAHSEDFWKKQLLKGRAFAVVRRGAAQDIFVLDVCDRNRERVDLSGY
jgi:GNAT superfamily N-acetyltransferase